MSKTLVLYVFHEINERVFTFLNKAVFQDPNITFLLIANNKDLKFVVPSYVLTLSRDNIGYDFGGWSEGLHTKNLYKDYDNFIFVNSSVVGPFVRSGQWTNKYIEPLNDTVKLFGSTINTIENPLKESHVQSYIFSMKRDTLEYLMDVGIFSMTNMAKTFLEAVWEKEVKMSRKIIEKGWNIGCLWKYYKDVDFTFLEKRPEEYPFRFLNDIMYTKYYLKLWNEYDLVFVKGNRITHLRL
jgi:hypothetical protein